MRNSIMKKIILIAILSFNLFALAQTPMKKIIFYDSTGIETLSKEYSAKTVIKEFNLNKISYEVETYTKTKGKDILVSKYTISDKNNLTKNGEFTSFYESGAKKELINFNNDIRVGSIKKWYENGAICFEGKYDIIDGKPLLLFTNYWNQKGEQKLINGNGTYEYYLDNEEKTMFSGAIKNELQDGVWVSLNTDFPKYERTYENGKLIKGKIIKSETLVREYTNHQVDANAEGGIESFRTKIGTAMLNFKQDMGIDIVGDFRVRFTVNTDGTLSDFLVQNSINEKIDAVIIEKIKKLSKWNSAIYNGREVKAHYTFPMKFR